MPVSSFGRNIIALVAADVKFGVVSLPVCEGLTAFNRGRNFGA